MHRNSPLALRVFIPGEPGTQTQHRTARGALRAADKLSDDLWTFGPEAAVVIHCHNMPETPGEWAEITHDTLLTWAEAERARATRA